MTMDYDLWLSIGERSGVRHVDAVWGVQRIHATMKSVTIDSWPERLAVSRRHGGRLVSPLWIKRHIRSPGAQRVAARAASTVYALAGKRPR